MTSPNLGYYTSVLSPDVVRVQVFLALFVLAITVYMVTFWHLSHRGRRHRPGNTQPAFVHAWVSPSTFTTHRTRVLPDGFAEDVATQTTVVLGRPVRCATDDADAAAFYAALDEALAPIRQETALASQPMSQAMPRFCPLCHVPQIGRSAPCERHFAAYLVLYERVAVEDIMACLPPLVACEEEVAPYTTPN